MSDSAAAAQLVGVDDDSNSVNSTVPSEPREEYPLEAILAERVSEGTTEYLVRWKGYSDERCTWETKSNFQDDRTLQDWAHKKLRIARQLERPYDVNALENRVEKWIAETAIRKARRRAKRLRLGLPVASEDSEDLEQPEELGEPGEREWVRKDDSSSSEAMEYDDTPLESPKRRELYARQRSKSSRSTFVNSESEDEELQLRLSPKVANSTSNLHSRPRDPAARFDTSIRYSANETSSDEPLLKTSRAKTLKVSKTKTPETSNTIENSGKVQPQDTRLASLPHLRPVMFRKLAATLGIPTAVSASSKIHPEAKGPAKQQVGQVGRGPARIGEKYKTAANNTKAPVQGAAIMRNWNAKRKPQKPMSLKKRQVMQDNEAPKNFKKLSIKRKYRKAGQYEPAPNPDALTFVDLKDGKAIKKLITVVPSPTPKTLYQMIQENIATNLMPSTEMTEDTNRESAMEIDNTMMEDVRVESPGTTDANQSMTLEAQKGAAQSPREFPRITRKAPFPMMTSSDLRDDNTGTGLDPLLEDSAYPSFVAGLEQNTAVSSSFLPLKVNGVPADVGTIPEPFRTNKPAVLSTSELATVDSVASDKDLDFQDRILYPPLSYPNASPLSNVMRSTFPREPMWKPSPTIPDTQTVVQAFSLRILRGDNGGRIAAEHSRNDKPHVENVSDIFGTLFFGLNKSRVGDVVFRGLTRLPKQLFMTIKQPPRDVHVMCKLICTAEDYQMYLHSAESIYYGAGHIVPRQETEYAVNSMCNTLKALNACGIFFAALYTLIVYPAGFKSWIFLDKAYPIDAPKAALRFIICAPVAEPLRDIGPVLHFSSLIMAEESGPNALFRHYFGIAFAALLPQGRNKSATETSEYTFYLLYPREHAEECSVLAYWLRANGAIIYSSLIDGDLNNLATLSSTATFLIHDSVTAIHLIPHLSRFLRKPVNVFHINLRPAIPPGPDSLSIKTTLIRLFPHGAAILLTDSLILRQPHEAVRILSWFQINILYSKPVGTWKILMRPRPREWLLNIVEGRSKDEGRPYMAIYEQLCRILPLSVMDEDDDFETPTEDAQIVCSRGLSGHDQTVGLGDKKNDGEAIASNDNRLVEWFADWSSTKLEYHRKFHTVHGEDARGNKVRKEWAKRWTYIMPLTSEEFTTFHDFPNWEAHKKKAEERRRERVKVKERRNSSI